MFLQMHDLVPYSRPAEMTSYGDRRGWDAAGQYKNRD